MSLVVIAAKAKPDKRCILKSVSRVAVPLVSVRLAGRSKLEPSVILSVIAPENGQELSGVNRQQLFPVSQRQVVSAVALREEALRIELNIVCARSFDGYVPSLQRLRVVGRFHNDHPRRAVRDGNVVDAELVLPVFEDPSVLVAAHVLRGIEKDVALVLAEFASGVFLRTPPMEGGRVASFEVDGVGRIAVVDRCPETLLVAGVRGRERGGT